MQVSSANDVKIYNLTSGKSIPEWISEKKKKELLKKNVQLSRRIELIQDFDMPGVSSCVGLSPDQQFVVATGMYKPIMKCYDVNHMSLKFERCFDNEVIKFLFLSDDYTKLLFLQQDRFIEFHNQGGRYFRLRVPKYSRDLVYNDESCDVFIATASCEVYRLNLERGCFLSPLMTSSPMINTCRLNESYRLLLMGSDSGRVEAWDTRARSQVGVVDCRTALSSAGLPHSGARVTAMDLSGGLHMAVGLNTGHVLVYDIRSDIPLLVKDHHNEFPIKDVKFQQSGELIYSLDRSVVKIWNQTTGKPYTSILSDKPLNSMCVVPRTGLVFLANDAPKLQVHYIPSIGPAPKWCSFLDSLTEELEESVVSTIYDNYKFVTRQELEGLGLTHLLGTQLLRAYMHGFFIDLRLYQKAKSMIEPFSLEEYRKKKITEKLDATRDNRVKITSLASVNKELASKLLNSSKSSKSKNKPDGKALLNDTRFQRMFHDPDYQIDQSSSTYKLLHPVLTRVHTDRGSESQQPTGAEDLDDLPAVCDLEEDEEQVASASSHDEEESSDDDDGMYHRERREQQRIQRRAELQVKPRLVSNPAAEAVSGARVREVRERRGVDSVSLQSRLERMQGEPRDRGPIGSRQMTFALDSAENKKKKRQEEIQRLRRQESMKHHEERRRLRRSAAPLKKKSLGTR